MKQLTDSVSESENTTSKFNFAHTNHTIAEKSLNGLRIDCNYIFLDNEERNFIVNNKHEFLIKQVQYQSQTCLKNDKIFLNFNNPIKELIFVLQSSDITNLNEFYNYSGKQNYLPVDVTEITETLWNQIPKLHLLDKASIELNGNELVPLRDYKYWHLVQNYENYRNTMVNNLYIFSFGVSSEENKGSCNFSELDEVALNINLSNKTNEIYHRNGSTIQIGSDTAIIKIFAVNYNIFKIDSGMGSVLFPY